MFKYILKKIRLISNARKEPYFLFYKVLGFYPDCIDYYQLAVRHKSLAIPSENGNMLSNERLEFLGDAVLNTVVADILYHKYQHEREGFLTNMRSKIVKRDSLNQLAISIGLDKLMKVTKYVNANNNSNIYGNALEALVGAVYVDYGYEKSYSFVKNRLFDPYINLDRLANDEVNFKSKLIEWCQKNQLTVHFELVNEAVTKANTHLFTTALYIDHVKICEGKGASKKESQQQASRVANDLMQQEPSIIFDLIKASTSQKEVDEQASVDAETER